MTTKLDSILYFLVKFRRIRFFKDLIILVSALYFVFTFVLYFYGPSGLFLNTYKNKDVYDEHLLYHQMNNSSFAVGKYYLNEKNNSNRFQPFDKHLSKLTKQRLLNILNEIENELNLNRSKIALVKHWKSIKSAEIEVYIWTLKKHGFKVRLEKQDSDKDTKKWLFLICLGYNDVNERSCLDKQDVFSLKLYQKVNQIFSIKSLLKTQFDFCSIFNKIQNVRVLIKHPLSPLCFFFPQQYHKFLDNFEALGYSVQWTLKSLNNQDNQKPINIFNDQLRKRLGQYLTKPGLAQQIMYNPLFIFDSLVKLRMFVLLISINPLRAYLHQEGLVYYLNSNQNDKVWTLNNFFDYISKTHGQAQLSSLKYKIEKVLTHSLLIIDAFIQQSNYISKDDQPWPSTNGFQLLSFDLMLNSTFDPMITGLLTEPLSKSFDKQKQVSIKVIKIVLDDIFKLITAKVNVAQEVINTLEKVLQQNNIGIYNINCRIVHQTCLNQQDLRYLLESKKEMVNLSGFSKLYPSVRIDEDLELIHELDEKFVSRSSDQRLIYKTKELNNLLIQMERIYKRNETSESILQTAPHNNVSVPFQINDCSQDSSTLPFISFITFKPNLNLHPSFSPMITHYYANASYDYLNVNIYSLSKNCQTEVRLEHKFGQSRLMAYTLGIGVNKINLLVVDISQSEPSVINTYTIYVEKESLKDSNQTFSESDHYMICSLKQNCDLQIYPKENCGLQQVFKSQTWSSLIFSLSLKRECQKEEIDGRWLVPCFNCNDHKNCFWSKAIWDPIHCRYSTISKDHLLKCLANRKILFIGDSTNRGMMHYLIEKMNDTLTDGTKSHDLKVYDNLNYNQTFIAFNYYPKFWLAPSQRLSFDKSLVDLISKVEPLKNNSSTVIIFGGVHWLATQHIRLLISTLSRLKLEGVKLIMKSLGSGFHKFIEGSEPLTLDDERELAAHNSRLVSFALKNKISVVETFNMTMARFKDFYSGKCACHFHKVNQVKSKNSSQVSYHIEGPVNAAISEIFIRYLCS